MNTLRHNIIAHIAILILAMAVLSPSVSHAQTIVLSTGNGDWSDASTWSTGAIPTAGQPVTILPGHIVTYDVSNDAVLGQINVEGTLTFSRDANTRLKVGKSVIVHPGGYLDMGNADSPIPASVKLELIFVMTLTQANAFNNTDIHTPAMAQSTPNIGLWAFGRWDSHGAEVVRTWSKLAQTANSGATSVVVTNDVTDWPVNGSVVIMPTSMPAAPSHYNTRILSAVERLEDGTSQLTLTSPVNREYLGGGVLSGEVGLLTRNVKISTELIGELSGVSGRKYAHTVYMHGASGDLQYTELYKMGHFNRVARYAIHHHRILEHSMGMIVRGNSVWMAGYRCINVHVSHGLVVEDNVCYNVLANGIFSEGEDSVGYNQDNVFIHNLVGLVYPLASSNNRIAAFWVRDQSDDEAWIGNVAVGGAEIVDGAGYGFGEGGNDIASTGEIGWTFLHNEAHGQTKHGIFSWQNTAKRGDMIDTLLWGVGFNCIRWGAYRTLLSYYNTQCLNFGSEGENLDDRSAVNITSINPYIQDAIISGGYVGVNLSGYVLEQYPGAGATFSRVLFQDITAVGIYQKQKQFPNDNKFGDECGSQTPGTPSALQVRPVWNGDCSGNFVTMLANQFVDVVRPLRFGQTANPNSYWVTEQYVYVRKDLQTPGKCGVITCKLINGSTSYDAAADALRTPLNTLPDTLYHEIYNARPSDQQNRSTSANYTQTLEADYPPVVSLDVEFSGSVAKLSADAIDDNAVSKVDFYLNWQFVGTDSEAPYTAEYDLFGYEMKYAYFYAKATDDTGQRAYSQTMEIGPELLELICAVVE